MLKFDILAPQGGKPRGWCFVLHGLGDSRRGWRPVLPMLGFSDIGFVLVEAPIPYYDGFAWFDLSPETFSTGQVDADNVRASRAQLAATIAQVGKDVGAGRDHMVLMGFSQGGLMVMDAALHADTPFAGIVCISGFIGMLDEYPAAFGPAAKTQKILMTHGVQDHVVPLRFTKQQMQRLRDLGIPIDWREYAKDHGLDDRREIPDIRSFVSGCLANQQQA